MTAKLMGILNLTPDSFYQGSRFTDVDLINSRIADMVSEGAEIIDVGAESSRPGAVPITAKDELERLSPVFDILQDYDVDFSIDTYKPEVARAAVDKGFNIINDITGGGKNGEMFQVAADFQVPIAVMHMQGNPETMQKKPDYSDVIQSISDFFSSRLEIADSFGLNSSRIILDPGIGFGKRLEDNDTIIRNLSAFTKFGSQLLIGVSRKSFLAVDNDSPSDRLTASLAALVLSVINGANIVRVHDVKESMECIKLMQRIYN